MKILASLLVAQWLGRWCTGLVAQDDPWHVSLRVSYYKGGNPELCCCHLSPFRVLHAYVLTCLLDLCPEIVIKGIRTCNLWVSVLI